MGQVNRETVAQVDHGSSSVVAQPLAGLNSRSRIEVAVRADWLDLLTGEKLLQDRGRAAQFSSDVYPVTGTSARTQHGFSGRDLSYDRNVRHDVVRGRNVTARKRNFEAPGQIEHTGKKAIYPFLRQFRGKSQREKTSRRLAAHGGDVAESPRQTAVSHASRRMPCSAKVHIFDAKIGCHQELMAWVDPQNGTVVTNAADHGSAAGGLPANAFDEFSFRHHQSSLTIADMPPSEGTAVDWPKALQVPEGQESPLHHQECKP